MEVIQKGPMPGVTIMAIEQFQSAMADAGITTSETIIPDGRLHRIHINGHRHGSKNGAYLLHLDDHPAGWFQDFKAGVTGTWSMAGGRFRLTETQRQAIERAKAERRREREESRLKAAAKARQLWAKAKPCTAHPYLSRKQVVSHGLRVADWTRQAQDEHGNWQPVTIPDALLVPLFDEHGTLWNLQAIFPEPHPLLCRDKDFLSGGRQEGLFHCLGKPTHTVLIGEGYATAATCHRETGYQTFVAFTAGNLMAVAQTARHLYPSAKIILCADNDAHTPGNPGITKARAAALAVGALLAIPPAPGDWNDYATRVKHA